MGRDIDQVYVLPMRTIWMLQMSTKKKAMVTALFALGGVSCTTSIVLKAHNTVGESLCVKTLP